MASKLWTNTKEESCLCDGISTTNRVADNQHKCPSNIRFVLFSS